MCYLVHTGQVSHIQLNNWMRIETEKRGWNIRLCITSIQFYNWMRIEIVKILHKELRCTFIQFIWMWIETEKKMIDYIYITNIQLKLDVD